MSRDGDRRLGPGKGRWEQRWQCWVQWGVVQGWGGVPLALGSLLSMLNQRMEAQALESWLLLEMMTKGSVEVCGGRRRQAGRPQPPPSLPQSLQPSPPAPAPARSRRTPA